MNLQSQTTKINVIVSFQGLDYVTVRNKVDTLKNTFNEYFDIWACCIHDCDTKINEYGEKVLKTLHLHFVGIGKRRRLLAYLNDFSIWFGVSTFAVTIDKMSDFGASCRYLIHKDDPDKYLYEREDIITNMSKTELDITLDRDSNDGLTADKLLFIIGTSSNMFEVMQRCGLSNFQHYNRSINMLLNTGYKIGFMKVQGKDIL